MANIVTIKRSSVAGKQPNVSDLQVGELALNLADGIIYSKNTVGNVIVVGSSTTSNITEGSNLYVTNSRSKAAVANTDIIFANLTTTGNLTIGSGVGGNITGVNNLYTTNLYSNTVIANVWSGIYTANVVESTSLYFTNSRAVNALTAGSGISIASNGLITSTATSGSSNFNSLIGKPANVINISNALVSYYETYTILTFDKNVYRSGEVRYNITDDNTSTYSSVAHYFIHGNNSFAYSNTVTSIGSPIHNSHMALVGSNIVLFIASSNVYATDYFLSSSSNYQQNVTANLKGYVSLIEV